MHMPHHHHRPYRLLGTFLLLGVTASVLLVGCARKTAYDYVHPIAHIPLTLGLIEGSLYYGVHETLKTPMDRASEHRHFRYEEAYTIYKRFIERAPNDPQITEALYYGGLTANKVNKFLPHYYMCDSERVLIKAAYWRRLHREHPQSLWTCKLDTEMLQTLEAAACLMEWDTAVRMSPHQATQHLVAIVEEKTCYSGIKDTKYLWRFGDSYSYDLALAVLARQQSPKVTRIVTARLHPSRADTSNIPVLAAEMRYLLDVEDVHAIDTLVPLLDSSAALFAYQSLCSVLEPDFHWDDEQDKEVQRQEIQRFKTWWPQNRTRLLREGFPKKETQPRSNREHVGGSKS